MDSLKKTVEDIRALRIQGARNVAFSALRAIGSVVESSAPEDLEKNMRNAVLELARARPTEPAMREVLTYALRAFKSEGSRDGVLRALDEYENEIKAMGEKVSEYGARRVPDGGTVITHCHSTNVVGILRRAKEEGKEFRVIVTETRPRYQGKITAKELLDSDIPITYVVDSAAYSFMRYADIYLTGADAITSDGHIVNKVGTALMAVAARRYDVPFYVAASTLKYDPVTAAGFPEHIEERDPAEVINPEDLPGAEIRNPSFDVTPPDLVDGVISELGIYAPQIFPAMVSQSREVSDLEEMVALFHLAGGQQ